jgi:hypothetical protein
MAIKTAKCRHLAIVFKRVLASLFLLCGSARRGALVQLHAARIAQQFARIRWLPTELLAHELLALTSMPSVVQAASSCPLWSLAKINSPGEPEMLRHLIFTIVVALVVSVVVVNNALAADQAVLSEEMQNAVSNKYPNHKLVKSCSGDFVGKHDNAIAIVHNEASKEFVVLWIMSDGNIQQLDAVTQAEPEFELQCVDAKEAKEREHDVHTTDTITGTLKALKGLGAVCYFSDDTTAKCWSLDRASGRLIEIGGWLT